MARTSEAKTYRRVPGDVDEVRYISELIAADAKARLAALVAEEKYDEMHALLEYRDKWKGMLADLVEEAEEEASDAANQRDIAAHRPANTTSAEAMTSRRTAARNQPAGGATKASADEPK
jgi:hypothetical protein